MTRITVRGVMDDETARALAPAVDARRFDFTSGSTPVVSGRVVLAATGRPIAARQAAQLRDFVRGGGGLVLLGGTLAAWSSSAAIRELAGWMSSGPGPVTELVLRPSDGPEWKVRDALYLSEGTVRNYLSSCIQKTGARNRAEALRLAEERGWL